MTGFLADPPDYGEFDRTAERSSHRANGQSRPAKSIPAILASSFAGKPVPSREFHVPDLIPTRTVTTIGGDGGTGKSTLAKQLLASTVLNERWIGRPVRQGRAVYLGAEDDIDEIHRRLFAIAGLRLREMAGLKIIPLAGEDAVLAAPGAKGVLSPTPLWGQVVDLVEEWKPNLLVLDNLADVFAGEENNRAHARQFVGMIRGVAIKQDLAAVLLAHPSLTGMSSGTGSSGSTAWNNAVRSRLYLSRIVGDDGVEPDPDARLLTLKKSNYSRVGEEIRLRWTDGMFLPETPSGASGMAAMTASVRADRAFLDLLTAYTVEHRNVSATPSPTYAPALFAKDPRGKGIAKNGFVAAMNRLFEGGEIETEEFGPPAKRRNRIVSRGSLRVDEDVRDATGDN